MSEAEQTVKGFLLILPCEDHLLWVLVRAVVVPLCPVNALKPLDPDSSPTKQTEEDL